MKPKLLDLFCGAGGAAKGYDDVGFEVVGVDIEPQKNYPFEFIQADAMTYPLDGFDVVHASPPCQRFTSLNQMYNAKEHPDLLTPMLDRLRGFSGLWVVENVPQARRVMSVDMTLCGTMFGLGAGDAELWRHRIFQVGGVSVENGLSCAHRYRPRVIGVYGGHGRDRRRNVPTRDFTPEERQEAMGIDWMTGEELSQAIPPVYTECIGRQLISKL